MQLTWPPKFQNEVLDYKIDWIDALDGDQIAASSWEVATIGSGLTINEDDNTTHATQVWLANGNPGTWTLQNTVQTVGGRTYVALVRLVVRPQP